MTTSKKGRHRHYNFLLCSHSSARALELNVRQIWECQFNSVFCRRRFKLQCLSKGLYPTGIRPFQGKNTCSFHLLILFHFVWKQLTEGQQEKGRQGEHELFFKLGIIAKSGRGKPSVVVPLSVMTSIYLCKILFSAKEFKHEFSQPWVRTELESPKYQTNALFSKLLHEQGNR